MKQSKTLKTIQIIFKIAKVLSIIVFVCSIIGTVGCIVGLASIAGVSNIVVDGKTVGEVIQQESGFTLGELYASMAGAIVLCVSEGVLAFLAKRYFNNELKAGTPFTFEGAKEAMRFGIIDIIVSIAAAIVAAIVIYAVVATNGGSVDKIKFEYSSSISTALLFLFFGLIFKLGAEQAEAKEKPEEEVR